MKWKPMCEAPHDQQIAIKHRDGTKMIVKWDEDGWWLQEGSLFQDSDLIGWYPIPE